MLNEMQSALQHIITFKLCCTHERRIDHNAKKGEIKMEMEIMMKIGGEIDKDGD